MYLTILFSLNLFGGGLGNSLSYSLFLAMTSSIFWLSSFNSSITFSPMSSVISIDESLILRILKCCRRKKDILVLDKIYKSKQQRQIISDDNSAKSILSPPRIPFRLVTRSEHKTREKFSNVFFFGFC